MARLPINTFLPLKTEEAVLRLVRYMTTLKTKDVYAVDLCLSFIYTKSLKKFFCKEVIKENIYSGSSLQKVEIELKANEIPDKKRSESVAIDKSSLSKLTKDKHLSCVDSKSGNSSKPITDEPNHSDSTKKSKKDKKSERKRRRLVKLKSVESRFYSPRIIFETPAYPTYNKGKKKTTTTSNEVRSIQHEDVFCIASGTFEKTQQLKDQAKNASSDNSTYGSLNLSFTRDASIADLNFRSGSIEYLFNNSIYKFYDNKINSVSKFILRELHQTVTLRLSVRQVDNAFERTFTFENETVLDDILAIIRNELSKSYSSEHYYQDKYNEVAIDLPWNNVKFFEGGMLLTHPNASKYSRSHPYYFRNPSLHSRYNDFKEYMELNIEKLKVSVIDGQIKSVLNFRNFEKYFPHFTESTVLENGEITNYETPFVVNGSYNVGYFKEFKDLKKSPFLTYLSKVHLPEYRISYLLESAVHESSEISKDEFGFLFTIYDKNGYLVLFYENEIDLSRSSILFVVRKRHYESAINSIARFLSSDETNKREKLARGTITINNNAIRNIIRLSHTNYTQWRNKIYQITVSGI